jgi:hypothetical protein
MFDPLVNLTVTKTQGLSPNFVLLYFLLAFHTKRLLLLRVLGRVAILQENIRLLIVDQFTFGTSTP